MGKGIDIPSYLLGTKSGGGGGGTSDYNSLSNKPTINGVTLEGTMSSSDLNIPPITYGTYDLTPGVSELAEGTFYFVYE